MVRLKIKKCSTRHTPFTASIILFLITLGYSIWAYSPGIEVNLRDPVYLTSILNALLFVGPSLILMFATIRTMFLRRNVNDLLILTEPTVTEMRIQETLVERAKRAHELFSKQQARQSVDSDGDSDLASAIEEAKRNFWDFHEVVRSRTNFKVKPKIKDYLS